MDVMVILEQGFFLKLEVYEGKWDKLYEWLHTQVGAGNYQINHSPSKDWVLLFKNKEDAMAFKLRWI